MEQFTFKGGRRFSHTERGNDAARGGRETCQRHLIHIRGNGGRGYVHCFGKALGGEISDELSGFFDVADAVLAPTARETDDGRLVAKGVIEAVWREVDTPMLING